MKKRKSSWSLGEDESKKTRSGVKIQECSDSSTQEGVLFNVEYCNIHLRSGFTARAIAYNALNGRLCVIRRLDKEEAKNGDEQCFNALTIVEFYNAMRPPLIFMEKSIPVNDSFDALLWMGSWAVLAGSGGRLTFLSPFTNLFGRTQICATDIHVMAHISETQIVIGNSSSELLVLNKRKAFEDKNERDKVPAFSTIQAIKLSNDEHITALSCSKTLKPPVMAVGKVNGLSLYICENNQWRRHKQIVIPHTKANANIIWAVVFVDNFIFAGDARGQIGIYNAESGSLLKTIKTHQAPVLSMATDGNEVFASGTDYRIQVICSISHKNVRFDWQQSGQRLFHSNDVRALCLVDRQWLVSGGAEHELFVSSKFTHSNLHVKSECSLSKTNSKNIIIMSRNLSHLDLWFKSTGFSKIRNSRKIISNDKQRFGLDRLMRITSGKLGFIKQTCISPNGNFIAFAGAVMGAVRVLRLNCNLISEFIASENAEKKEHKLVELYWSSHWCKKEDQRGGSQAVSAMFCTNNFLYIARGEFTLTRLDFNTKQLQTLASKENGGHIVKLCVDKKERSLVALTMATPLYFELDSLENSSDGAITALKSHPLQLNLDPRLPPFECHFYDQFRLLFLTADMKRHLIFYDLSKKEQLMELGREQLKLVANEWVAYFDVNENGCIIATTNKGRIRMIMLEKTNLHVLIDENSSQIQVEEIARSTDTRIEPFWYQNSVVADGAARESAQTLIFVKYMSENPPTQSPYRLKFFGKN